MSKFRSLLASYIILEKDNHILLAKRHNTGYMDGWFSLPAGHVEKGETFSDAVIRETQEETNVKLNYEDIQQVFTLQRLNPSETDREYIDVFFKASKWENPIINLEEDKCSELSWHPITNLPENTIAYIKTVIEKINNKETYLEQKQ